MKLWILRRTDETWYDEYLAFVVRAETEQEARELAVKVRGDENEESWLDSKRSTCEELTIEGISKIILGSFNAG